MSPSERESVSVMIDNTNMYIYLPIKSGVWYAIHKGAADNLDVGQAAEYLTAASEAGGEHTPIWYLARYTEVTTSWEWDSVEKPDFENDTFVYEDSVIVQRMFSWEQGRGGYLDLLAFDVSRYSPQCRGMLDHIAPAFITLDWIVSDIALDAGVDGDDYLLIDNDVACIRGGSLDALREFYAGSRLGAFLRRACIFLAKYRVDPSDPEASAAMEEQFYQEAAALGAWKWDFHSMWDYYRHGSLHSK